MYNFYKKDNIVFSTIEEEDLDFLIKLRSEIWDNLGTLIFLNKHKEIEWFKKINADSSRQYFIINSSNNFNRLNKIGLIRIDEIDYINSSARIGIDISIEEQNKNYGQKSLNLLIDLCFNQMNLHRLWLFVLETNIKAIHIYEKFKFEAEGIQKKAIYRNGKYLDYIMMSLIKE